MSLKNLTNNREDMTVPESGLDCSAVMNKNKKISTTNTDIKQ